MVMNKKQSMGRQKIAISKIPKKNHLQVTFSKRRAGLFKKASELCTLCGVEIALIVFSPANKAFSFGHPEVESIIDRFMSRSRTQDSGTRQLVEAHRNANVRELNMQLTQLNNQLEIERKKGEEITQIRRANERQWWWESPVEKLGVNELQQLKVALEELKKNVGKQVNKMVVDSTTTTPTPITTTNHHQQSQFLSQFGDYEMKPKDLMNATISQPRGYNNGVGFGAHRLNFQG